MKYGKEEKLSGKPELGREKQKNAKEGYRKKEIGEKKDNDIKNRYFLLPWNVK